MNIRILVLAMLLLDGMSCFSQDATQHIVQRGETFEIVARRYGMTVEELKLANPWMGTCYAGLKLDIPEGKRKESVLTDSKALTKAYLDQGRSLMEEGKYKSAISNLERVMGSVDLTPMMKEECEELLAEARAKREEQVEKRNDLWGGIAAALVTTAAVAATTAAASSSSSAYSPDIEGWENRDRSLDYLLDPRYSMMQVQMEDQRDYQNFKMQTGRDISFEEFWAMKYQAMSEMERESSGSTSSSSTSSYSNKSSSSRRDCPGCHGSGTIVRNDGTIPNYGNGHMKRCSTCGEEYWSTTFHRHVTCHICHGREY